MRGDPQSTNPVRWLAAAALCVALVAAGCGGDDDAGVTAPAPAAPEEAVAEQPDTTEPAAEEAAVEEPAPDEPAPAEPAVEEPDGDDSAMEDDTPAASDADDEDPFLAEARARLEAAYNGSDRPLPSSSPPVVEGANVWVISCGESIEGCARGVGGAAEAGAELGWDITVFDGEGNPAKWTEGIYNAIADGADGIVLGIIDCIAVAGALEEVKAAGIVTTAFYATDCDDPLVGGESLITGLPTYGPNERYTDHLSEIGRIRADHIIVATDGRARIIEFTNDQLLVVQYEMRAFEEEIARCRDCEILETIDFTLADLGPNLTALAQAALTRHPDANAIIAPYDIAAFFVAPAVVESGRNDEIFSMGGEGLPSGVEKIRNNAGVDAGTGIPSTWVGWAAIDDINRMLNGEGVVDSGIGWQHFDRDRNLPAEGQPYDGTVDYRANYRAIWGLGG